MKKAFKKSAALLLVLSMLLSMTLNTSFAAKTVENTNEIGSFAGADFDYTKFAPGATLVKNGTREAQGLVSATGYFVVFVYEEQNNLQYLASPVTADMATGNYVGPFSQYDLKPLGKIAKVELKSNDMLLFDYTTMAKGQILDQSKAILPENYTNDVALYPAGGDGYTTSGSIGKINYQVEMTRVQSGNKTLWCMAVPLPSGTYDYNYRVTDVNGNVASYTANGLAANTAAHDYLPDPANPPKGNADIGSQSRSSTVSVPYDPACQAVAAAKYSVDRHVQVPLAVNYGSGSAEAKRAGTLVSDSYTSERLGGKRGIAVYLPYGYSESSEPYNVLYISHGAQTEYTGNEYRWMNEIAADNIMDNLILEGKAQPFIIVSIDNKVMWNSEHKDENGGYEPMYEEIMEIVSYVEGKYNVAAGAANRAMAGLSMGGMSTSYILANHPNQFAYFAMYSGATAGYMTQEALDRIKMSGTRIFLGQGDWDYVKTDAVAAVFDTAGIQYDYLTVPGSHDWNVWSLLLAETAQSFFFNENATDKNGSRFVPYYEKYVEQFSKTKQSTFVEEDAGSPTGYTVTFLFEEQDVYKNAAGTHTNFSDLAKVELHSDCMMLSKAEDVTAYGSKEGVAVYSPYEFEPGMFASNAANYVAEMYRLGNGLWGTRVPLYGGACVYDFWLTNTNGDQITRLDDPNNHTLINTATGKRSQYSMVYVPYDAEKQGTGAFADRSVENPIEDASKKGTLEHISYTGVVDSSEKRGLLVYLPAGYSASRAEAYPVVYLSHGAYGQGAGLWTAEGADTGEARWMNEGAVCNIMDNLIAQGRAPEFVVVTMDNASIGAEGKTNWDQDSIAQEFFGKGGIIETIESKYNVRTDAAGRAMAGLSMGARTTSTLLANYTDQFGYYAIWSYAAPDAATEEAVARIAEVKPNILFGCGITDGLLSAIREYEDKLDAAGISYSDIMVPAAHDWEAWQLLFAHAAENFFFTEKKYADQFRKGEIGSTVVDKDPASPTGYTVTFIFEEQDVYKNAAGTHTNFTNLEKVQLHSDCMMLARPEDVTTIGSIEGVTIYNPSQYKAGMFGSTSANFVGDLKNMGNGLWVIRIPLASGARVYDFWLTNTDGDQITRLDDPNNPTLINTATGKRTQYSMVYVPYDAEKQGTGAFADRSVENPIEDASKKGTLEHISYTGVVDGTENRGLLVYLPVGYNAKRSQPYPVLYLSHGMYGQGAGVWTAEGADTGEARWMNEGAVCNIMDNLIAQGRAPEFVVVTMDNQSVAGEQWNQDNIAQEFFGEGGIIETIESKYNVRTDAAGRAMAGLSMGAFTTSTLMENYADQFGYYGVWSYANAEGATEEALARVAAADVEILVGYGIVDILNGIIPAINSFKEKLDAAGIAYSELAVPGGHDWETWQLLFAYAAENFFFNDSRFDDVEPASWYETAVNWAAQNGYVQGVGDNKFAPDVTVNNAQILNMLWKFSGSPRPTISNPFGDTVSAGDWWYRSSVWAFEKGLISQADANAGCTRSDMVVYLWKLAGEPESSAKIPFADVPADADYAAALAWAAENGVTQGDGENNFRPNDSFNRAEMVQFFYNVFAD